MKILITGCNKNQCTENFYLRQQLKVIPSHYSLIRCLRDMGHEVHQREVDFGDALDYYDKIILFLAGPRQLVSVNFYGGLNVAHPHFRDKLILAFDDWQIDGIFKSISECVDENKLFARFVLGVNKVELSDVERFKGNFLEAIDLISSKELPVLISAFSGGDVSRLLNYPEKKVFTYNPNPFHHNRKPGDRWDIPITEMSYMESLDLPDMKEDCVDSNDKEEKFNFASLVQSQTKKWLKKQNIEDWEVEFFGSKKDGQRRLTEGDMVKVFCEQWGCLMPGYYHAGSGWWRARPLQVADAGSILIGDPDEMNIYYHNDELANIKASDIEGLSVDKLSFIARAQREAIYRNHPLDKEIQKEELNRCIRS